MAKPTVHARNSARRYGGQPDEYLELHELLDSSKSAHATVAHRCVFHSAFGVYLVEKVFGKNEIVNSAGRRVSVRGVAEDHVLEDLGFIPSLDEWLKELTIHPWMAGARLRGKPTPSD